MLVFGTKAASHFFDTLPVPDMVNAARRPQISVVWKSIESLGRLGVLARVFPDARSVTIFRHPCGYVASVLRGESKRKFEGGTPSSEDWGVYSMLLELDVAKNMAWNYTLGVEFETHGRIVPKFRPKRVKIGGK